MKKNMKENFEKLEKRVVDALYDTDLEKIYYELHNIKEPILVSGVGGSSVVANFVAKTINEQNHIIATSIEPRSIKYMDLSGYKNILSCSFSGKNYGVKISFLNNLKHYLFSSKENSKKDIVNLTYNCKDKENSFISLATTIIPCGILVGAYLGESFYRIIDNLDEYKYDFDVNCDAYEIFTGYETSFASKFLESTMVESGIGIPIVHDKYSYCHGRSTLCKNYNNIAIYFNLNTGLDKLLIDELYKYYKDVIVINTTDSSIGNFNLLLKCAYLTKYIAESKEKDLSGVDYNEIVKKLYKYDGDL